MDRKIASLGRPVWRISYRLVCGRPGGSASGFPDFYEII